MEPQPQMQPINPVEGRPFAEPQQPLDLQPKRQPLDLRPRPNYRPLDVPDLRPARVDELRPSMNPLDRSNRQGAREAVGRVVNNPIGYTPGKALTWPLAVADRSAALHDELTQPNPMQTLDIPSIPLPDESFPDLETSSTSKLSPDALDNGPLIEEGIPATEGNPGGVVGAIYGLFGSGASGTVSGEVRLSGPITNMRVIAQPNQFGNTLYDQAWDAPAYPGGVYRVYVGMNNGGPASYSWRRVDGGEDPEPQPEQPPRYAKNPARKPAGNLEDFPDFLDAPDFGELPGFQPEPQLLPPTAPTGEIVPYRPPAWEPPDRIPYAPPEKQPFPTPPEIPDFEQEPDRPHQKEKDPRKTYPRWWEWLKKWEPPDPWTNRKPRKNWPEDPPETGTPWDREPPPMRTPDDSCCLDTLILLQDIQRRLRDLEIDSEIPSWRCDTEGDEPTPVQDITRATDLSEAINLLGQGLANLQQALQICPTPPTEQAEPSEIARGQATEAETVWYIPLPPLTRQVELIITGTLPQSFRLYETTASGEQQAKFGAISLSCPGVTGGHTANAFHQWCWTRRTSLYIGNRSPRENFLRVYVRSGLSWILYDTGLRE